MIASSRPQMQPIRSGYCSGVCSPSTSRALRSSSPSTKPSKCRRRRSKACESCRDLGNAEIEALQIILVGQPELEASWQGTVRADWHSDRRARAHQAADLPRKLPLYLHRTRCAGRSVEPATVHRSGAAVSRVRRSREVPRTINICCDNALINGYGHAARSELLRHRA